MQKSQNMPEYRQTSDANAQPMENANELHMDDHSVGRSAKHAIKFADATVLDVSGKWIRQVTTIKF